MCTHTNLNPNSQYYMTQCKCVFVKSAWLDIKGKVTSHLCYFLKQCQYVFGWEKIKIHQIQNKVALAALRSTDKGKKHSKNHSWSRLRLIQLQLIPEAAGYAVHSWCQRCDVCVRPTEAWPLSSDGVVRTEVQMKAGGSRGHRQTVMKQQCDLQLAGLITRTKGLLMKRCNSEYLHFTASQI